ncbi:sulfotransferase 1B1-like [Oppia nitens]|uniref:sulfotransferase 1B1-like n=1 Tax=Oppia nitens TaxID=1686743 RepID=UPI0023D97BDC|nr:sulfotransferase 1B1-like [Oppia nitens]
MYAIICNGLRGRCHHLMMNGLTSCCRRLTSGGGVNQEVDNGIKRIRLFKRVFAIGLFGITLTTAVILKRQRSKQWHELMAKTKRLQGQKFGDLELYEMQGLVISEPTVKDWLNIESFVFRDDDIVVTAFPKSGITWLQEIVWLLANELDFKTAKSLTITDRFPYLEFPSPGIKSIERMKVRRYLKTHLTPTLLFSGKQLNETTEDNDNNNNIVVPKMITIFRNPKDLIVSYYHFCRMNKMIGFKEDFDHFFDRFISGSLPYGPVWNHYLDVLQWNNSQPDDRKILVIHYEDLKKDFANQVNRISEFLGKPKLSDDDMKQLTNHCSFDQMKYNPAVNYKHWDDLGFRDRNEAEFMRRGQIGDWKYYFSKEQNHTIDKLVKKYLQNKIYFVFE